MSTTSSSSIYHSKSSSHTKDRKRSAHWTDLDTETLVNLLLTYKDSGRTIDNGFKSEIWEEASSLLEGNTYMGGPKTPDACKSRWQRLQRDYKAAKDMEAMPGFTWDRTTNRLSASPECWTNAEKQLDSYKYRKIHLPTFDSIGILCSSNDTNKSRPRVTKGRTSLGSISNTSSMLSLSTQTTTSTSNQGLSQSSNGISSNGQQQQTINQIQQQTNNHNLLNDQNNTVDAMAQLQVQQQQQNDQNVFNWSGATTSNTNDVNGNGNGDNNTGAEEDGQGEFDNAFNLSDASQPFNLGQKRPLPFDPSMLSPAIQTNPNQGPGPPHNTHLQHNLPISQGSPPKKPRQSRTHSHIPQQQQHQNIMQQNHPQHVQQHQLPPAHTIPQGFYLPQNTHTHQQLHQQHQQSNSQIHSHSTSTSNLMSGIARSPDFNTTHNGHGLLDPSIIQTPPTSSGNSLLRQFTPINPNTPSSSNLISSHSNSLNSLNSLQEQIPTPSSSISTNPPEISESQRRTEAIIQLQQNQEILNLEDDELVEILIEFENNINTSDTFLAIKKNHLKKLWLKKIVKRRLGNGSNGSGSGNGN